MPTTHAATEMWVNTHGIAWAYRFDVDGNATPLQTGEDFQLNQAGDGFVWAHLNLADARAVDWLAGQTHLPPNASKMLQAADTHQLLDQGSGFIWGVVSDLIREFDRTSEKIGHLRFVMGERFLLSARRQPLQGAEKARQLLDAGQKVPAPALLLEAIVERVVDAMASVVEHHIDQLNDIEDRVLDEYPGDDRAKLGKIRRAAARLNRQLTGMRTIFHRFELQAQTLFSGEVQAAATRLVQRIEALHQEVHATQERARLLQEEISSRLSNDTNRNLALLTVVTALFLPPTLITGMFGMNVKGMLFTDSESGYLYAMALCVASAAFAWWLMRRAGMVK